MTNLRLRILRLDPATRESREVEYQVPATENLTVLAALLFIYEKLDSSLNFEFGCRFGVCGWCSVRVDGKPGLACRIFARDGQKIEAVKQNAVEKDLRSRGN